ncbi:hypothetical protein ScPMuIL_014805 [Solemya velum]
MTEYKVITQSVANVTITSSANTFGTERRFQKDVLISQLKGKLELLTGSVTGNMKLELFDKENKRVCILDNDDAMLGSYPVEDGMRIHVTDPTIKIGEFEDVSRVEKFEISAEEYSKRTDSVRAFKQKNKLGEFREVDPEEQRRLEEEQKMKQEAEKQKLNSIKIGDRCETRIPGQPTKRGSVKYIGTTEFKAGNWIGVQYDEPLGKNDGSVQGKRYFDCPPKYGGFVKPDNIEVGDFPEEDFGLGDDEEM